MDKLLEYFYNDVMRRCWNNSGAFIEAWKEWEDTCGEKGTIEIKDAALLLAEKQGRIAFFPGLHLGFLTESTLWQELDQEL